MKFPKYSYKISDDKYEARIALFKYLAGIYIGLIAASLIGFEKAKAILGTLKLEGRAIIDLKISIIVLILAIVQAILVLALTYYHKYYNAVFLEKHRAYYEAINGRLPRAFVGGWIWLEHMWAVLSTFSVRVLAGTWYVLPLLALYYLGRSYLAALS